MSPPEGARNPAAGASPQGSATNAPRKLRVATTSLAGCFGCHMSFLDIDERLFELVERIEFDRSPLTDIKTCGPCDIGFIEGGLCNAENVHVLREFREHCRILVAVGACAITGGLPAQRNHLDLHACLQEVYETEVSLAKGGIPNDPELPLPHGHAGDAAAVEAGHRLGADLARDERAVIPAVGAGGRATPLPSFATLLAEGLPTASPAPGPDAGAPGLCLVPEPTCGAPAAIAALALLGRWWGRRAARGRGYMQS